MGLFSLNSPEFFALFDVLVGCMGRKNTGIDSFFFCSDRCERLLTWPFVILHSMKERLMLFLV